jgi:hypothetical protein
MNSKQPFLQRRPTGRAIREQRLAAYGGSLQKYSTQLAVMAPLQGVIFTLLVLLGVRLVWRLP